MDSGGPSTATTTNNHQACISPSDSSPAQPPLSAFHDGILLAAGRTVLSRSSSIRPSSDGLFPSRLVDTINDVLINHIQASDHTCALQWPPSLNSCVLIFSSSTNSDRQQSHHPILITTTIRPLARPLTNREELTSRNTIKNTQQSNSMVM